jgi:tRNA A-37 threonylcarbamoyl transferase component Bud32
MDTVIGQTFGPYKITERIGEGGMAVVYKGYQQSLNRYVAIKVLRTELAQDQEFVTRFRREALAVAEMSHPNILHVYDAGYTNGMYYIVMAFVDGGSLKELVSQGPVEMDYAVSITTQVADALHHAHQRGLIHRDVKPNNILMSRDGRPLLTDFGIAKALHESTGLTRTGTSIGTPEYMAPEQVQGQKVDGRTDIYALGIVLYEMLVGWVPFSAHTPVAALYKQVNEPPPPPRQANINVPDWLEAVVLKALAKSPHDRFQQASDFSEALRQRQMPRKVPTPVPATARQRAAEPRAERRRRGPLLPILIGGIVILLLALAAVGIFVLMDGTDGEATVTPMLVTRVITRVVPSESGGLIDGPPSALVTPAAADQLTGDAHFDWEWGGSSLADDHAFELRIWSQQEEDAGTEPRGAIAPTRRTEAKVDLGQVRTIQEHGPGVYYWTVVVVDANTQRVVGELRETRTFLYNGS